MDFTVSLAESDWDSVKGGWRCPALQIPGAAVKTLYVSGSTIDPKLYEVDTDLWLIRWAKPRHPEYASVHIRAEKALSTEELTLKWKKVAIVLPVLGSLLTGLITTKLIPKPKSSASSLEAGSSDGIRIYLRSNDFLNSAEGVQFTSSLKMAKREAWFAGTTFYISVDQYHDLLLQKLADGVDLNFLVLDPYNGGAKNVADLLGVTEDELSSQCLAGIRTLERIRSEAQRAGAPGVLNVKLSNQVFQSRLYFFDPKSDQGTTYYVPQINGTNSQFLPGFLVNNGHAKFASVYFNGLLKLWNSQHAQAFADWKAIHNDFR